LHCRKKTQDSSCPGLLALSKKFGEERRGPLFIQWDLKKSRTRPTEPEHLKTRKKTGGTIVISSGLKSNRVRVKGGCGHESWKTGVKERKSRGNLASPNVSHRRNCIEKKSSRKERVEEADSIRKGERKGEEKKFLRCKAGKKGGSHNNSGALWGVPDSASRGDRQKELGVRSHSVRFELAQRDGWI